MKTKIQVKLVVESHHSDWEWTITQDPKNEFLVVVFDEASDSDKQYNQRLHLGSVEDARQLAEAILKYCDLKEGK